ncbi:hypothetical protein V6N13_098837 [Hibiscus sabdariffa]|uniref:Uncharacterized protein n=1 Tax=Hibiscus sabdariffa TaxID=183260 RepID=A0ABR2EGM2_9ROSI
MVVTASLVANNQWFYFWFFISGLWSVVQSPPHCLWLVFPHLRRPSLVAKFSGHGSFLLTIVGVVASEYGSCLSVIVLGCYGWEFSSTALCRSRFFQRWPFRHWQSPLCTSLINLFWQVYGKQLALVPLPEFGSSLLTRLVVGAHPNPPFGFEQPAYLAYFKPAFLYSLGPGVVVLFYLKPNRIDLDALAVKGIYGSIPGWPTTTVAYFQWQASQDCKDYMARTFPTDSRFTTWPLRCMDFPVASRSQTFLSPILHSSSHILWWPSTLQHYLLRKDSGLIAYWLNSLFYLLLFLMDPDLLHSMENLQFTEAEAEMVVIVPVAEDEGTSLWLVGSVITDKVVDGDSVGRIFRSVWKSKNVSKIVELRANFFLIKPVNGEAKDMILKRRP